jgi:hypothetical protein
MVGKDGDLMLSAFEEMSPMLHRIDDS